MQDPKERKKVVEALRRSLEQAAGTGSGCFYPHHGIRAKRADQTVEVVICMSCCHAHFYLNGELIHKATVAEGYGNGMA